MMVSHPFNSAALRVFAATVLLTSAVGCSGDADDVAGSVPGPAPLNDITESMHAPMHESIPEFLSAPISENLIADTSILIGTFIDGAIEGLSYKTDTQTGTTNNRGEYIYKAGEDITFSIGALKFPTVPAAELLTPFQLAMGSANPLPTTLNIARLLQSLDDDGIPENGIRIGSDAAMISTPVNFDVSPIEFENNADVINLIANSGSVTTALIHISDSRF